MKTASILLWIEAVFLCFAFEGNASSLGTIRLTSP